RLKHTCDHFVPTRRASDLTEALSWNPLEEVPPFRTGINRTVGMSVAGGSDRVQYFLSGGVDKEDGIYKSNEVDRINMRANLDARSEEHTSELQSRENLVCR